MHFTTLAIVALTAFTGVSASAIDALSAKNCKVGGCGAELCLNANAAEPGFSVCVYKPEFECFKTATCQYNARDKSCNWKTTPKLTQCLQSKAVKPTPLCKVSGCNKELCVPASSPDRSTICLWKPEFACFKTPAASCEFDQTTQSCGWAKSDELSNCITQAKADADGTMTILPVEEPSMTILPVPEPEVTIMPIDPPCKISGCNKELCVPSDSTASSMCMWKPEFQCYKEAQCGYINKSKICGWKSDAKLTQCIKQARLGN